MRTLLTHLCYLFAFADILLIRLRFTTLRKQIENCSIRRARRILIYYGGGRAPIFYFAIQEQHRIRYTIIYYAQ